MSNLIDRLEHYATAEPDAFDVALLQQAAGEAALMLRNLAAPPVPAADGRAVKWRVRLRLFDAMDELQADSDPDKPTDEPGADIVDGLAAAEAWARSLAGPFHAQRGEAVELWPDAEEVKRRTRTLRPQLSRSGGRATWRLKYRIGQEEWLARLDILRESDDESA